MIQNKNVLKSFFETGDKPSQQNYFDLIDSLLPMIGEIRATSFAFAPQGWRKCNGELLAPSKFPELFALIGTTYGGDGVDTFALPNLSGRVPLGYGTGTGLSPYTIGQTGGEETNVLTEEQLPSHSHTGTIDAGAIANITIPSSDGTSSESASGNYIANNDSGQSFDSATNTSMAPFTAPVSGTVTTNTIGNSEAINNIPPYIALNYIIAVEGFNPL